MHTKGKHIVTVLLVFMLMVSGCSSSSSEEMTQSTDDTQENKVTANGNTEVSGIGIDEFEETALGGQWVVGPEENQANDELWSLEDNPGFLTITTQDSDVYQERNEPKNFFLQDAPEGDYEIVTKLSFGPRENYEQAGLIIWQDADNYVRFSHVFAAGNKLEAAMEFDGLFSAQQRANKTGDDIYLKIQKFGESFTYFASSNGQEWQEIGFGVETEHENEKVGLFAISPASGRVLPATFDFFEIKLDPKPQEEKSTEQKKQVNPSAKLPEDTVAVEPTANQIVVAYSNPVFSHDAPDPAILKAEDGYYYSITTQTQYEGKYTGLPILRTKDLVNWEQVGEVFPELPEWMNPIDKQLWAPDFVYHDGKYYVYYSGLTKNNDEQTGFGIGVAVADNPLGPYEDKGEPLVAGPEFTTIDPMVFQDSDGERYMYWGSAHEPILIQKLSADGLSFEGEPKEVLYPHFGDVVNASSGEQKENYSNLVEGPWVIKRADYYYMFYSGDKCCGPDAHYAVMVARATSPTGPFEKYDGGVPILKENDAFYGLGHNAIITDEAGQDWILYHAYDKKQAHLGRVLLIDKVEWKNGWPVINSGNGPSSTEQEGPIFNKE